MSVRYVRARWRVENWKHPSLMMVGMPHAANTGNRLPLAWSELGVLESLVRGVCLLRTLQEPCELSGAQNKEGRPRKIEVC